MPSEREKAKADRLRPVLRKVKTLKKVGPDIHDEDEDEIAPYDAEPETPPAKDPKFKPGKTRF